MHDAFTRHDTVSFGHDKLWVTRNNDTYHIYEYKSKEHFKNESAHKMKLIYPFQVGGLKNYN